MFRPIYEPRGRAQEYCDFAINIYDGCNHGCTYCWAKKNHDRWKPKEDFSDVKLRPGIVEATQQQLASGNYKGKKIMLCFTTDPYPAEIDTTPTREIIKLIKAAGAFVQILTKGGMRAARDFDLLGEGDSFGATITYNDPDGLIYEPMAAKCSERLNTLIEAKNRGIHTWVSCEPVVDIEMVYRLIKCGFIDLYRIGKMNYYPSDINFGEFGRECERVLKIFDRNYYLKEDLRAEMERPV